MFHNGILFDGPVLTKFYKKHGITLTENIKYIADPLYCCRDLFKNTKDNKIITLAAYCAVEQTPVHDTIDNSFALKKICVYLIDQEKNSSSFFEREVFQDF